MSLRVVIQGRADGGARRGPARPPRGCRQPAPQKPVLRPRRCWVPRRWSRLRRGGGGGNLLKLTAVPPAAFQMLQSVCVPGRGWRASPRTLRQWPCPETMAALLWVEARPWQNTAARRDPARWCPDSPGLPGCPRGRPGKSPTWSSTWAKQRLVTPTCWGSTSLRAEVLCYFLQLVINAFENLK